MIIRLALAYAAAALVAATPGLILAVVAFVKVWRDQKTREDA